MNRKLSKKLRNFAKEVAANNNYPDVAYLIPKNNYTMVQTGIAADGTPEYQRVEFTGTIKVDPKSLRGIYRILKKQARSSN